MKILLLGAGGQVGHQLCRCLAPLGAMTTVDLSGHDLSLDLSRLDRVERLLEELAPDLVANAAAYTAVDAAEDDAAASFLLNRDLPATVAAYAKRAGAAVIHYSTDYVFDGRATSPYPESSAIAPIGVYGQSKYEGEEAVRESGCDHLILRTAWVYSTHGKNFLRTILGLARERSELSIVDDQVGTPTWARALAQLTAAALDRILEAGWSELGGTYHVSAGGPPTSWFGFAETFLGLARERGVEGPLARLKPVPTEAYPTRARRPRYSVLDNRRFERRFGLRVADWRTQLRWCMEDFVPMPGGLNHDERRPAAGGAS